MHRSGTRSMLAMALFFLALAVALPAGLAPSTAAAQDDQFAVINLDILRDIGSASLVPVRVNVASSRAVEGRIVVQSRTNNTTWEYPIALAANTQVAQTFVAPTAWGELQLDASLVVDGEEVADTSISNNGQAAATNAVGVIGVEFTDDQVPLTPQGGTAALLPLTDLALLAGLDSVLASPAGMASLTPAELSTLLVWIGSGHQLLIADSVGTIDSALPPAWQGTESTASYRLADTGLIRYVGRDWQGGVAPGLSAPSDQRFGNQFNGFDGVPAHRETLADAGFRVPGIRAIAVVLMIYLLIAGPVAFGVLHVRQQRTKAWVVVPALAMLFTVGVLVVGGFLTRGRGNSHATIVEVTAAGAAVTDTVLLADSGRQTLDLPQGWSLVSGNLSTGNFGPGSDLTIRPTRNATSVEFDIGAGSGGTAILQGADDGYRDALTISNVAVTTETISGVVQNNSDFGLSKVVAMVGNRATVVPDIAPGTSADFVVELAGNGRANAELRLWGSDQWFRWDADRDDPEVIDGVVNASAWSDWRAARGNGAVPSGTVTVVGWTRDSGSPTVSGTGRTALVARHNVGAVAGPISTAMVRHIAPRSAWFNPRFGPVPAAGAAFEGQFGAGAHQFIRPAGSSTDDVALRVNAGVGEVQVWTADGWRSLGLAGNQRTRVAVPAEGWIDDALWVRAETQPFGGPGQAVQVALEDLADPPVVELLPIGQRSERTAAFEVPAEVLIDGPMLLGLTTEIPATDQASETVTFDGFIENSYDVWRIELADGDRVVAEMNVVQDASGDFLTPFGPLDPFMQVYDNNRFLILENDDGGESVNSRVEFTAESAGWYEIEMRPLRSQSGGPYEGVIVIERGQQ